MRDRGTDINALFGDQKPANVSPWEICYGCLRTIDCPEEIATDLSNKALDKNESQPDDDELAERFKRAFQGIPESRRIIQTLLGLLLHTLTKRGFLTCKVIDLTKGGKPEN